MKDLKIVLDQHEMLVATMRGAMRNIENVKLDRPDRFLERKEEGWQHHLEGVLAECVVAKAFNLYWSGNLGDIKAADVGIAQVRSTHHTNGRLIIHKPDEDSDPNDFYILVTGINGDYVIRGGIWGHEGQDEQYWDKPSQYRPAAYFVPQSRLSDIEYVKKILDANRKDYSPQVNLPKDQQQAIPWLL